MFPSLVFNFSILLERRLCLGPRLATLTFDLVPCVRKPERHGVGEGEKTQRAPEKSNQLLHDGLGPTGFRVTPLDTVILVVCFLVFNSFIPTRWKTRRFLTSQIASLAFQVFVTGVWGEAGRAACAPNSDWEGILR